MMKKYTTKAVVRVPSRTVSKQDFSNNFDEKLNSSSFCMKSLLHNVEEGLWDITENSSYCTESSYEEISVNSSDIEEISLSPSDSKSPLEEKKGQEEVIDSSTQATSLPEGPIISCCSHHSKVSDITDADYDSFHGTANNLKQEIAAIEYIVSKHRKYFFSKTEISNRLGRLKAAQDDMLRENSYRAQFGNRNTKKSRRKPRKPSRKHRSKKSRSPGEDAPKSSDGFVLALMQQSTQSLSSQKWIDSPSSVRTRKTSNSKEKGIFTTMRPSCRKHRPSFVSIDHAGQIIEEQPHDPSKTGNTKEPAESPLDAARMKRMGRKGNVSSFVSIDDHAGLIVEEFVYRPRPSKTGVL
ncbi:unnamed protein product [Cylindrotheca closterium]|uniref:Uncharacterized protein n=1 Tax=Cylindrotheca closterium TaxID=2856 RepID=A0AAD2CW47_9STRA|nr:unnamed protein product [Cylindrotheca closterium]